MNERASVIKIGGKGYELLLTVRATKEISKRFGGIGKMGSKFETNENLEESIDDLVWVVCLLANQGIARHNFENPNDIKDLLTAEAIELYSQPADFADFKDAITDALYKGTKREVPGEEKN